MDQIECTTAKTTLAGRYRPRTGRAAPDTRSAAGGRSRRGHRPLGGVLHPEAPANTLLAESLDGPTTKRQRRPRAAHDLCGQSPSASAGKMALRLCRNRPEICVPRSQNSHRFFPTGTSSNYLTCRMGKNTVFLDKFFAHFLDQKILLKVPSISGVRRCFRGSKSGHWKLIPLDALPNRIAM